MENENHLGLQPKCKKSTFPLVRFFSLFIQSKASLFYLLALALVLRIATAFMWNNFLLENQTPTANLNDASSPTSHALENDGPFFYGDSDSYWKLARALAFGRAYEFDELRRWQIFRTPGYPAILAPLFWVYGENPPVIAGRIQGALFGVLNVALIYYLTLSFFRKTSKARAVAACVALYMVFDPTHILQSISILSEESFMSFSLLLDILLFKLFQSIRLIADNRTPIKDGTPSHSSNAHTFLRKDALLLLLGLALTNAISIYIRPSWFYFFPFACLSLIIWFCFQPCSFKGKINRLISVLKSLLISFALVLILTHLFLLPWGVRNYFVTGRYIVTSLQMGASLYDGLNPNATGASDMSFVDDFRKAEQDDPSSPQDEHFEVRLDQRLKNAALQWANNNKLAVLSLGFKKLYSLWAPVPREATFRHPLLKYLLLTYYLPIFLLGMGGLLHSLICRRNEFFFAIPALYVTLLHTIFVASIRYRVPVFFGIVVLGVHFFFSTILPYVKKHMRNMPLIENLKER